MNIIAIENMQTILKEMNKNVENLDYSERYEHSHGEYSDSERNEQEH